MKPRIIRYTGYIIIGVIATAIANSLAKEDKTLPQPRDYAEIRQSGILRATTEYNSLSYFADGDSISGFQYELLQAFVKSKDLKMEITPLMSFDDRMKGLAMGKYDIIAYNIPTTSDLKDTIALTEPIMFNKQVLVQRKEEKNDSTFIHNQLQLAHRTVNMVKESPAVLRIRNLSNEIGDTIYIKEVERYGQEQLMAMVAHGDIDYAVCDENLAKAIIDSLPMLDISMQIGFTQFCAWGVNKQSPILLDTLNAWIKSFIQTKEYKKLYKKYYKD